MDQQQQQQQQQITTDPAGDAAQQTTSVAHLATSISAMVLQDTPAPPTANTILPANPPVTTSTPPVATFARNTTLSATVPVAPTSVAPPAATNPSNTAPSMASTSGLSRRAREKMRHEIYLKNRAEKREEKRRQYRVTCALAGLSLSEK